MPPSENMRINDFIDTNNKYATIFIYISGKDAMKKFFEGRGWATATAGGVVFFTGSAAALYGTAAGGITVYSLITGATVTGTAALGIPVAGWIVGGILLAGAGALTIYVVIDAKTTASPQYPFITFMPYSAENMKNIGCEHLDVLQMTNSPKATK